MKMLIEAHIMALVYLQNDKPSKALNLGNGRGYSVQEVIGTARQVRRREIKIFDVARRAGDLLRLVANARLAREVLVWQPRRVALETIAEHAWAWEQKCSWK